MSSQIPFHVYNMLAEKTLENLWLSRFLISQRDKDGSLVTKPTQDAPRPQGQSINIDKMPVPTIHSLADPHPHHSCHNRTRGVPLPKRSRAIFATTSEEKEKSFVEAKGNGI
jgi:hypothetical protein